MNARTPEDVDRLFCDALNAGDLDALAALYEPHASLCPQPGARVTGTAAIRDALATFVAMKPRMTMATRVVSQAGDVALLASSWQLSASGPDGKPAQMAGSSVEVVRRQPDGSWKFAIDEPFGVGE